MPDTKYFTKVPKNQAEWTTSAAAANVVNKSLKSCRQLRSGSRISQVQYLLFRTIWPMIKVPQAFNPTIFNLATEVQQARQMLGNSPAFQNYLAAIGTNTFQNTEEFTVPLLQQREVLDAPDPQGRNKLADIDETSVNSSLISLLQAITSIDPTPSHKWRSARICLVAKFGRARQYMAYTDGQLQDVNSKRINTIIECKVGARSKHSPQVQMQEVSQIVAWIKEYPEPGINAQ